jgi:hypothetical protein
MPEGTGLYEQLLEAIAAMPGKVRAAAAAKAGLGDGYDQQADSSGEALVYALETRGILTRVNVAVVLDILESVTEQMPDENVTAVDVARRIVEGGATEAGRS